MAQGFGNRLKDARHHLGYTQEQLAVITNISLGSIRRYEQECRDPTAEYLLTLAEALDVTPEFLLKGANEMNIYTAAIEFELCQIRSFDQLQQIKATELNSTILSHLELGEKLVTNIHTAWMKYGLFDKSCTRAYVKDIIVKYCQNRQLFRDRFGLKDGTLRNNIA